MKTAVKFESDSYTDLVYDANGKGHTAEISYEGYYYDRSLRLVKLSVKTNLKDKYLQESVLEMIHLREGKRIELECQIEIL